VSPGERHQIDRGLGVARPDQNAAVARPEWEHVPGSAQVIAACVRVGECAQCAGAICGRHPGSAVAVVDGDGERGCVRVGVVVDHLGEVQCLCPFGGHGGAQDPGGVPDDEGDLFRRGGRGRHDEVALVLPVGIVHHDNHLTGRDGRDGPLDGEGRRHRRGGAVIVGVLHRCSSRCHFR